MVSLKPPGNAFLDSLVGRIQRLMRYHSSRELLQFRLNALHLRCIRGLRNWLDVSLPGSEITLSNAYDRFSAILAIAKADTPSPETSQDINLNQLLQDRLLCTIRPQPPTNLSYCYVKQ